MPCSRTRWRPGKTVGEGGGGDLGTKSLLVDVETLQKHRSHIHWVEKHSLQKHCELRFKNEASNRGVKKLEAIQVSLKIT